MSALLQALILGKKEIHDAQQVTMLEKVHGAHFGMVSRLTTCGFEAFFQHKYIRQDHGRDRRSIILGLDWRVPPGRTK